MPVDIYSLKIKKEKMKTPTNSGTNNYRMKNTGINGFREQWFKFINYY